MRLSYIAITFFISLSGLAIDTQAGQVFYVLDTSQAKQSELLENINTFYRGNGNLTAVVTVVDISPEPQWFVGEVTYFNDRDGDIVASLKPNSIPSLLVVEANGSITRTDLTFLQGSSFSDENINLLLEKYNDE
ncbi:hypothetical protein [Vibrio hepatarius]|uniref:hypothetical protein n=1 Tax=Vibrio hepatarius TaxID=171383 RepID=UPI001C0A5572|nr:hypothetical protein [Vibrio hepatarius]MBU2896200.1 hypothetical protein [Vibrio hepatarius]